MRILVTNDDGIHAPGLAIAEQIARELSDDVWVVAPETEQSGASHSLTLSEPLRLREIAPKRYAVSGTPTDCVMMACAEIMKDAKPDLVLSGVNRGANMADDVTYSGTIAGAMEGCALGIHSIALSQGFDPDVQTDVPWECGGAHGAAVVRRLIEPAWADPDSVLMNVNFPACLAAAVQGISVVQQGKRDMQVAVIDKRTDMRGYAYYWIGFKRMRSVPAEGTDLDAIYGKRISITPLQLNLTEHRVLAELRQRFER